MKTKEEIAQYAFNSDLNCAQSVITTFAKDLHLDYEVAKNISCGFGGGMGRLQQTCGAVTGAFMVLGLYNSQKYASNNDAKNNTYSMIHTYKDRFLSLHNSLTCKDLINCDLNTEEGQVYFKKNNLKANVCEKCITDSVKIVTDLMTE